MEEQIHKKLPDQCWELIFNKLDHGTDWDSVSLVCKDFLLITNDLKCSLAVSGLLSVEVLSRLLQRFRRIKKLQLVGFRGDLNGAVLEIARSQLNLEELDLSCNHDLPNVCLQELGSSLKRLKVLDCSRSLLSDADLVRIADCFPQLEELNIRDSNFPEVDDDGRIIAVTDDGIEAIASKLKRLRRVDLSGNQCISDKSLISLASQCAHLEHIFVGYCNGVTEYGVSFLLQNSSHLTSLVLWAHIEIGSSVIKGSKNFPRSLQSLKFAKVQISDEFLNCIALKDIPLSEISLSFCKGYTFTGISLLLKSYQTLKTLVLLGAEFLTNEQINYLSPFLRNLSTIKLYYCPNLSDSAFFMLIERCPLLTRLEMGETGLGQDDCNNNRPSKNTAIRSLNLTSNSCLSSSALKRLLGICPNVENLTLSNCFRKEELDVADILQSNSTIRSLELAGCRQLKFSGIAEQLSNLERVTAQYSEINDEILAMFGKHCPSLLHLNFEDCENITEVGVKEVVKSCTKLRFLSLSASSNVNVDVISWIVTNRPSLRRLISPSHLYPEQEDQNHFLQQGCLVSPGRDYDEFI